MLSLRQALGLPFVEQLHLGRPGGSAVGSSAAADSAATPQHVRRRPVRSLRLTGLRAVAALVAAGAAAGAAAVAEQPGLVLLPGNGRGDGEYASDGSFRAVLCSAYLAGLPLQGGRGGAAEAGSAAAAAAAAAPAVVPVEGGVSIAYSLTAGDMTTPWNPASASHSRLLHDATEATAWCCVTHLAAAAHCTAC